MMATLLNLLTPELVRGTAHFLAACQTFEGGLASAAHPLDSAQPPLGEAHGGYTFCAAASWAMVEPMLALIGESEGERLNVRALARWAAAMQGTPIEGAGFRGRANKLVDGCYSWWCGGLFPVIRALLRTDDAHYPPEIYDRGTLIRSICVASALTDASQLACKSTSYWWRSNLTADCETSLASLRTPTTRRTTSLVSQAPNTPRGDTSAASQG